MHLQLKYHLLPHELMVFKMFFLQAVVLAEYLEKNQEHYPLQGKAVIELGAGTGLVSMVVALLGKFD